MGDFIVHSEPDPVAIIGIGCRMPGNVRCPKELWELMMSERVAKSDKVPKSRFNIDAYLHPSNERPGSFNVPGGYFIDEDLEAFDPGMFGNMSKIEALSMDPQHRKLLEVVYEAFESSGTTLPTIASRKTGCFAATFTADFQHMATKEPDFRNAYTAIGVDNGMLANRISYAFDLKGPSMTVNTACSSSMYALHLACQAIAAGDCDDAIVGGTNLLLTVDQQMNTARMGVLSPTNQCHTFSEDADGYGRADGVGALYLRPLSHAIKNGDPIRAVIRATAVGSSGKCKDGMTHPSVEGQVDVIKSAYLRANLSPDETSYVECHGTGTPVGDPIEVEAIHKAMGNSTSRRGPVLIGSVKPNVGHSEAASSMATIIKSVLALENGIIPPTAEVKKLNPNIPWDSLNVQVVTKPKPWKALDSVVRRIGINAFGYGGTNSHAILESTDSYVRKEHLRHRYLRLNMPPSLEFTNEAQTPQSLGISNDNGAHLLLFSAHDEPTLRSTHIDYSKLDVRCTEDMLDLEYTMAFRRTKLPWRSFAIVRQENFQEDVMTASTQVVAPGRKAARPAFVFTGQGAQWVGMGVDLLRRYPRIVQERLRALDGYLSQLKSPPAWTIEASLQLPLTTSPINEAEYCQPLCTAIQIILVDLLNLWGITPSATIGHSSGEIAAAYAAGRISAQMAITAAYLRGKVVSSLKADGAMLAVGISATEASERYLSLPNTMWSSNRVVVACHNSPVAATLSGDTKSIEALRLALDDNKVFNRVLKTDGKAYHSHHMKQVAKEYEQQLQLSFSEASSSSRQQLPMFSTVWAAAMNEKSIPASYWVDNLVKPVLFEQGLSLMLRHMPETNLLIEIGPHPALSGPIHQTLQSLDKIHEVDYRPTLKRDEADGEQMLRLAGSVWVTDGPVDMKALLQDTQTCVSDTDGIEAPTNRSASILVDLPPYHWTYSTPYWSEPRMSKEQRQMAQPRHDILGRRILGGSKIEPVWRNILRQKDVPWLSHHCLGGEVMLPGAAYLALAIEAITQLNEEEMSPRHIKSYVIRDVVFASATVIPDNEEGTETLFRLQPLIANSSNSCYLWYEFSASCCAYGSWNETARGKIGLNMVDSMHRLQEPPQSEEAKWTKNKHIDLLDRLRDLGIDLGPSFTHIKDLYTSTTQHSARAELMVSKESGLLVAESRYVMHPTTIDSCMQPSTATLYRGDIDAMRCGTIPTHIREVIFFVPSTVYLTRPSQLNVWTPEPLGNRAFSTNALLTGHDGAALLQMSGFRHVYYSAAVPHEMRGPRSRDLYMQEKWDVDIEYLENFQTVSFIEAMRLLVHKHPRGGRVLCLDPALIPCLLDLSTWLIIEVAAASQEERGDISRLYGDNESVKVMDEDMGLAAISNGVKDIRSDYDLAVMSSPEDPDLSALKGLLSMLAPNGHLILKGGRSLCRQDLAATSAVSIQDLSDDSVILRKTGSCNISATIKGSITNDDGRSKSALLIRRTQSTSSCALRALTNTLATAGWSTRSQSLDDLDLLVGSGERVVMMDDNDNKNGILADIGGDEMSGIIRLTESAPSIIWVTRGGLLTGDRPEYNMTIGAARVIRTEKGSNFDLVTLDYDETSSTDRVCAVVADVLNRQHVGHSADEPTEKEYYIKNNVVHIPRLAPHSGVNAEFVPDSGMTRHVWQERDHEIAPAVHGQLDQATGVLSYHNDENGTVLPNLLQPDDVEVQVAAIGLTADDGADDNHFLSHQFAGTIVRAGHEAQEKFPPGSQVAGFASGFNGRLATFQRSSAPLIFPLVQFEGKQNRQLLEEAASIPSAFATAIYGIQEVARVEIGENVVIIDEVGAVGLAAVQLCCMIGASVIVITSSKDTQMLLMDNGLVNEACRVVLWDHNEDGRDACLRRQVQQELASLRGGIDTVLCCASVHSGFIVDSMVPFLSSLARIVIVGASDMRNSFFTMLPTYQPLHVSFFQLKDVLKNRPRVMSRIVSRCGEMYRSGLVKYFGPITVLVPDQVFQSSIPEHMGRGVHVVSFHENARFTVVGPVTRSPLVLKPDASYLLVGCLGGLGRAVALRMAERGARHLIFLSRSGKNSQKAALDTLAALEKRGVKVVVLRADVSKLDELVCAIAETPSLPPIRGVINAAGVLRDGIFTNMTAATWHEAARPKVIGSLNLHRVFSTTPSAETRHSQGDEKRGNFNTALPASLDFFIMTSSVASALGSGGQSNYAAANAFLDALARKRHAQGLPAVSLILPAILDVGYISEHQELERSITGKGMYGIYRQEMLEAFEIAMRPQVRHAQDQGCDVLGHHLVVGVQPRRFGAAVAAAGAHPPWLDDARYSWLGTAVDQQAGNLNGSDASKSSHTSRDIVTSIRRAATKELAIAAATAHVTARLTRLLMIDEASVDSTQRSVGSYGLDSMIGAEFRNWLFREFGADIPFQQLLAGSLTIAELANLLCESALSSQPDIAGVSVD